MLYAATLLATLLVLGQAEAAIPQYKSKWWRGEYLSWTMTNLDKGGDIPEEVGIYYKTGGEWERFGWYQHCEPGDTYYCIYPDSGYFRVNLDDRLRLNDVRVKYFSKERTTTEEWPKMKLWNADNHFVYGDDIGSVSNIWPFENRNYYADRAYQTCGGQGAYDRVLAITNAVAAKWKLSEIQKQCADGSYHSSLAGASLPDAVKSRCSPWTDNGDGKLTCTGNDGTIYTYSSTGCD